MSLNAVSSAGQNTLGPVVVTRMALSPPPLGHSAGALFLVALGLTLSAFAVLMAVKADTPMAFVAVGLPLIALGGVLLARRADLRCAFTLHERGFVVSRKNADSIIPFSEVQSFSLLAEKTLSNGNPTGTLLRMDFTWGERQMRVFHFTPANTQDTFAPVLKQLVLKLADAVEARIQAGQALRGQGWTLDAQGLAVGGKSPLRLSELGGVGRFDNKVCFWRAGEERPFFSIADESPNARLLRALARRQLPEHEQRQRLEHEQPKAGPLGRILFQRKMGGAGQAFTWILAVHALPIGLWLASRYTWLGSLPFLVMIWGPCVVLVILSLKEFRVHELGVTQKTFRQRTLRYSDLTSVQFGGVRHYRNGFYSGTAQFMRFTPGGGGKPITFAQTTRGNDVDLDSLRDQVSKIVAHHVLERLQQGEDVRWGPAAVFTQRGLLIRATKELGEERLVPYNAGLQCKIKQGILYLFIGEEHLFTDTKAGAALTLPCAVDNFYPGLKMLEALCWQAEAPQAQVS